MTEQTRIANLTRSCPGLFPLYLFDGPPFITISRIVHQGTLNRLKAMHSGAGVPYDLLNPMYAYFELTQGTHEHMLFGVEIPEEGSGDKAPIFYMSTRNKPDQVTEQARDAVITFLYDWLGLAGVDTLNPERTVFQVPYVVPVKDLELASFIGAGDLAEIQRHWADALDTYGPGKRLETHIQVSDWPAMLNIYVNKALAVVGGHDPRSSWLATGTHVNVKVDTDDPYMQQSIMIPEQKTAVRVRIYRDRITFLGFPRSPVREGGHPTLLGALVEEGLFTDEAGWTAWLDAHALPGAPRLGLPDLDVYLALSATPPPLQPVKEFLRWAHALGLGS